MKYQNTIAAIIFSTLALNAGNVLAADNMPDSNAKMSELVQKIQQGGYLVKNIEFDKDKYKVKALKNDGSSVELEVSSNGEIMNTKDADHYMSIVDAIQKVEGAGYKSIYEVSASKNKYEVKAYDQNSKKVSLDVDAKNGNIKD